VVCREACTEGGGALRKCPVDIFSERAGMCEGTAKSGTDEQKRYMRLVKSGKMTHHINAPNSQEKYFISRYRRHWTKENALTEGGLELGSAIPIIVETRHVMSVQEVIVVNKQY